MSPEVPGSSRRRRLWAAIRSRGYGSAPSVSKRLVTIAFVALAAIVLLWLVALRPAGDDDGITLVVDEPQLVSSSQLAEYAAEAGGPVYWLGEREGAEVELRETSDGRLYVRYLEEGSEAGEETESLAVGTYPSPGGVRTLHKAARGAGGSELGRADDGALVLIDPSSPNNVHLAYPGDEVQVEVYSPVPGQALRLASDGAVELVR
jgi:hypothetical protein